MNKKGESIAETIIALAILTIGITLSGSIVASAARNMGISKNRLIANNIAVEGLEAVRNIRDTNWLKFSNNLRSCWNHQPGANGSGGNLSDDTCDGSTPLLPGNYIVYKNDEFGWKIDERIQDSVDATSLYYVDIDESTDSDGDGDPTNDKDILNHILTSDNDSLGDEISKSIFNRVITIEYLENQPNSSTAPSNQSPPEDAINTQGEWLNLGTTSQLNRWRVTSTVSWNDRSSLRSLELKVILTDHFGRKNLID